MAPLLAAVDHRPQFDAQPARGQLLLASLSSSSLNEPQKAFLPRRAGGSGGSGGGDNGGGNGGGDDGGAKDLLADADENERFLLSEVRGWRECTAIALRKGAAGRKVADCIANRYFGTLAQQWTVLDRGIAYGVRLRSNPTQAGSLGIMMCLVGSL